MKRGDGWRLEVGAAYVATPAMDGMPKRLAVVVGRCGGAVSVAFADELVCGDVRVFEGRDAAFLDTRVGRYNISACILADAEDAAEIISMLRVAPRPAAEGDWPGGEALQSFEVQAFKHNAKEEPRRNCDRFGDDWRKACDAFWREEGDPADWRKLVKWIFGKIKPGKEARV